MKTFHTYWQYTALQIFSIILFGIWTPSLLLEEPLLAQLIITSLILVLFRFVAYRMISRGFQAFESAIDTLRAMLPNHYRDRVTITYDIYRPDDAVKTATNFKHVLSDAVKEQKELNLRYAAINMALERHVEAREVMLDIANELIHMETTHSFYDMILEKAMTVAPAADSGTLLTVDENNRLRYVAAKGFDLESLRPVALKVQESFLRKPEGGLHRKTFIIRDMHAFNKQVMRDDTPDVLKKITGTDVKSTLVAPIYVEDEVYGLINLDATSETAFTEDDLIFMQYFVTQISIAMQNRKLVERALYLSRYDKLTGIYNRSFFEERFYEFHERAIHGEEPFVLALMDLNNLKLINDRFGHIAGDQSLKLFVRELNRRLPEGSLLARYGGDEFICILPAFTTDEARTLLEGIEREFEEVYLEFNYTQIPIRFSYGFSASPDESMVLDILVKLADSRMYEHKAEMKRNTPFPFSEAVVPDFD